MISICGRKVKVCTRRESQTVNICTQANREGQYDYVVRMRPPSVSESELLSLDFSSLDAVVAHLQKNHRGVLEKSVTSAISTPTGHPLLAGVNGICEAKRHDPTGYDGLFADVFRQIQSNWRRFRQPGRFPSEKNWVLRVARNFTVEPDRHFEKQLQKRIAILMESKGWGNDVPTASGLVDVDGKHMNIDLAQQIDGGFVFVELKIDADDPYKAACQIARYAAVYMLYRLEPELSRRFHWNAMIRARNVIFEVLAPRVYYLSSDVNLRVLEASLDASIGKFAAEHCPGLTASFRFRAFPRDFTFYPLIDDDSIRNAVEKRAAISE